MNGFDFITGSVQNPPTVSFNSMTFGGSALNGTAAAFVYYPTPYVCPVFSLYHLVLPLCCTKLLDELRVWSVKRALQDIRDFVVTRPSGALADLVLVELMDASPAGSQLSSALFVEPSVGRGEIYF